MKAIELAGYKNFDSMQVIEMEKPKPAANEVLLEVKAAGINFAELELTRGRYEMSESERHKNGRVHGVR
jgi:NADPH:quinone reductase